MSTNKPKTNDINTAIKVVDLLNKYYNIHQAVLFGSRARGVSTASSDYDILVILDFKERSYEVSAKMMDCLYLKGMTEDIQILARTPEMFQEDGLLRKNILKEGVIIYGEDNGGFNETV